MSDESIHQLLEALPDSGVTPTILNGLDYLVPGEWQNITTFEGMIRYVTEEEDEELIQTIGERAIELYSDSDEGYQRAVWIYQMVDNIDQAAGAVAAANKLADSFSFLDFLGKVTPKADTTQAVDAGLKFAAELATFCLINGMPGDSVGEFASSLVDAAKEDKMRLAAWLALDCVIPLGPDFFQLIMDGIQAISEADFGSNPVFQRLSQFLPGDGIEEQRQLVLQNLDASQDHLEQFVAEREMTQEGLFETIKQYVDVADTSLDYVAAALDLTTNYFEHTGIQTVSRQLISRAYGEI